MVGLCKHHVLLVRSYHNRIHDNRRTDDAVDNHCDGSVDVADDKGSDVAWNIRGAGGEEEVGEVGRTDDEVDDQNHEKMEPEGGSEVHHANPMLVDDLLDLGHDETDFPEVVLSVHFEEEFEVVEAAVDAVVEDDRIVVRDLLMDVGDAHIVHNIDAHTLLHGHMPPRNLQRWQHCNSRKPTAGDARRNPAVDFADDHRTEDSIPYQEDNVHDSV